MGKLRLASCLLTFLWLCLLGRCKHLVKFSPEVKEEGLLYEENSYNCEFTGFINLFKKFVLHYCFFYGEDEHNGLVLRMFIKDEMKWGIPKEVLLTRQRIKMFSFIDDYNLNKLVLIYSYNETIRITVFNNYMEPSVMTYKISVNYEIIHIANVISQVTYFFKNKKSLYICGLNRGENILCSFSFDYGLTIKDDNYIEFILKKKIPISHYKIVVMFKQDYVYFYLYDDINDTNFYELNCTKLTDNEYTCDILNRVIKETENLKYKYILRNSSFHTIIYQKDNMCYVGWSFNSNSLNYEISRKISDVPCSHVSLFHKKHDLVVTYRTIRDGKDTDSYTILGNLTMKSAGCEFRVGGSLYVTNTFINNNCTMNVRNMDLTPMNHDDISFSIVLPSKFDIGRSCFNSNEMYENNSMSLYYLEEEYIEAEDIKIYTFFFYKYIVINKQLKESTCTFESDTSREKLNVYLTMDGYYKEYSCDMSSNLCDFFINEQSIIRIHYDDNYWDVDEELNKSNVLYNGLYISLNNILSHLNVNDFVHISHNSVVITIPDIIPSTRTIKIPFYYMGNHNKIKYAYLRLQQNVKSYKKVMGVCFSDIFDLQYEYFKYREEKMKFLLNHFSETNYIGMICQTNKEITTLPCTFSLVNHSNKSIAIHSVFPEKVPFLYYFNKKKGHQIDSYISETRFVVYKNFDILLQEKKIKYVLFKCICNAKNGHTETFKEIEYYITNENISKDMMNSPKIIHPSRNIKHSYDPKDISNINNSRNNPFRNNSSGLSHEDEQHFRKSSCVYSLLSIFLLTVTLTMFYIVSHYL
ncbi:6-cysteine protein [Plasmodium ovale]|uniref:6-cysteine protein n=2 Tax=Plasmodium ovale TaxID=36330 RepID=A0A1A8VR97_PLAOA|nr:hypothetical protein POVCU2_0018290 [Plasmodium ovale curtisi]SBS89457.1 hypothetical protein POVCU1_016600 [Plasmodium ovale curtisi]SCP04220.1 6-cysteine protein [Plasmodium ovale]